MKKYPTEKFILVMLLVFFIPMYLFSPAFWQNKSGYLRITSKARCGGTWRNYDASFIIDVYCCGKDSMRMAVDNKMGPCMTKKEISKQFNYYKWRNW